MSSTRPFMLSGAALSAAFLAFAALAAAVQASDNRSQDQQASEKPPSDKNVDSIGYPTVVEALIGAQKGMDAESRMEQGWTIVNTKEEGIPVHWFFTQKGHPAHPAAIKRTMHWKDGAWKLEMAFLCEGPKPACDKLSAEFKAINERLEKSWNAR